MNLTRIKHLLNDGICPKNLVSEALCYCTSRSLWCPFINALLVEYRSYTTHEQRSQILELTAGLLVLSLGLFSPPSACALVRFVGRSLLWIIPSICRLFVLLRIDEHHGAFPKSYQQARLMFIKAQQSGAYFF